MRHGVVRPVRPTSAGDDDVDTALLFDAAYRWAAERLGFWPLFLAVGGDDDDRRITGYQDQWRRSPGAAGAGTRAPGKALFSWLELPPGAVFMDFNAWHIVLNAVELSGEDGRRPHVRPLSNWEERQIWKRSWPPSAWMRAARRHTGVQAVVPELDLATAGQVWCRDQADRRHLAGLGFPADKVVVRRLRP